MTLTLCTIALDEQTLLPGLLDSVAGLVDEVVIGVDTRTTDHTRDIAARYAATVIDVDWCDDFSYARNLTLEAATSSWILALDADERLLPAGRRVVQEIVGCAPAAPADDAVTGVCLLIAQRSLDGTLRVIQRSSARLFRNRAEIRYRGIVHEEACWMPEPRLTTWALITGEPHFAHYGYDPTIWEQRGKYDRNRRLLEQRIAADPTDDYARDKLRALHVIGQ